MTRYIGPPGLMGLGGGDDVAYYVNGAGWLGAIQQGSASNPITVGSGPTVKISRTESIVASTMPAGIGANNQGNATLWAAATGDANNQVQVNGILATAINFSTQVRTATVNPDACGLNAQAAASGVTTS